MCPVQQGVVFSRNYLLSLFPLEDQSYSLDESFCRLPFKMKPLAVLSAVVSLLPFAIAAGSSDATASHVKLPATFKPAQVFKNTNLVHIISLEKNFAKESINVAIENIDKEPQDEYYIPFTPDQMERIGGIEVKDRKDANVGPFKVQAVEYDPER